MSRIGKQPIPIPKGIKVSIENNKIEISGPKGKLQQVIHPSIKVEVSDNQIRVTRTGDKKQDRALHGLTRAIIANMIKGVSEGYTINLDVLGLGYKVEPKGKGIMLSLGHTHPIFFLPPPEVTLEVEIPKKEKAEEYTPGASYRIRVSGCDKALVGQVAAKIRSFREPDCYKGKGIRYFGEQLRLKPGKAGGAAGAK